MTEHIYKRVNKCQAQDDLSDGSFGLLKNLYSNYLQICTKDHRNAHFTDPEVKIYN